MIIGCNGSVIPDDGSVKSIGKNAFYGCDKLNSIKIPDGVETIEQSAFYGCHLFTEIIIPDSVIKICDFAFDNCMRLSKIRLPRNLAELGKGVFAFCSMLTELTVADNNERYYSVGNCIIDRSEQKLVAVCRSSVIPTDGSVKIIGQGAFFGSGIEMLSLCDFITSIEESAFESCFKLEYINLPDSILYVGARAFYSCDSVKNISLGNKIAKIERNAFHIYNGFGSGSDIDFQFRGTKSEFESIEKTDGWYSFAGDVTVNCIDGDIAL